MKQSISLFYGFPRVICIFAILFISLFATEAFAPELTLWQQLVAWTWEYKGALLFTVVGLGFSPYIFKHNYTINHFIQKIVISQKRNACLSFLIPRKVKESFHAQYAKYIPNFYCLDEVCTQCMLCVKNCPRESISFVDGIKFGSICDMCLSLSYRSDSNR